MIEWQITTTLLSEIGPSRVVWGVVRGMQMSKSGDQTSMRCHTRRSQIVEIRVCL
jgi:hypothetical protein